MSDRTEESPPNVAAQQPLRIMRAWLWAGLGCITAYAIIRVRGLLAGDLLYNPDTLPTGPIPYFRWVMFSGWAATVFLTAGYWMTRPASSTPDLLRWAVRWLWLMALITSLAQFFLIRYWEPVG